MFYPAKYLKLSPRLAQLLHWLGVAEMKILGKSVNKNSQQNLKLTLLFTVREWIPHLIQIEFP